MIYTGNPFFKVLKAQSGLPKMEFDTIEEIADDFTAAHSIGSHCLITPKTEALEVYRLRRQREPSGG